MTDIKTFSPGSGVTALLDKIYEVKFSRSVPLVVILLSGIYAIYRSTHYIMAAFHLDWWIAVPTAIGMEGMVLSASANVFIQHRKDYIAELTKQDGRISNAGVQLAMALLAIAFLALIGIAGADAWMITHDVVASCLLTLIQIGQSGFIVSFVITALLDEREDLRTEYAGAALDAARRACPFCAVPVSPNNRARHIAKCAMNPKNQE